MSAHHHHPLRRLAPGQHARVGFVELFFDLVFVFAITQLSHALLHHLTPLGLVESGIIFLAVWWVWIYTSWATNWLDPEHTHVRMLLFAIMLVGLFMSIAIPQAFGARGIWFAAAYVAMQVGRTLFVIWAFRGVNRDSRLTFRRILVWALFAGIFWIAGALVEGPSRLWLWVAALIIDQAGPAVGYWAPGFGRSRAEDWDIEGSHMAERCGLFIIIALGESLLVTGATFQNLAMSPANVGAFLIAIVGTIAMWWLYFAVGAERGSEKIAASDNPGRIARLAYTYIHIPIVAGVVLSAVADEQVLTHPFDAPKVMTSIVIVGGPMIFLLGTGFFKKTSAIYFPLSHLVALGVLVVLALVSPLLPLIALHVLVVAVLCVAAAWEWHSLHPKTPPDSLEPQTS